MKSYNNKQFRDLPVPQQTYINSLKESNDAASLKNKLSEEQARPAREWVRNILLDYFTPIQMGLFTTCRSARRGHAETCMEVYRYGF